MSRAKKQKMTSSSSTEDFTIYLRDPSLINKYNSYSSIDIFTGRFVRFSDFMDYNLHSLFEQAGLLELYDLDNLTPHYPNLIYLFYTNLACEASMTDKKFLNSLVKGNEIRLTPKSIGRILNIPFEGIPLEKVEMDNDDILFNHILLPGKNLPMVTKNLRPTPRLVSRIISYNLLPKTGSFDHMSNELQLATYAIMANVKVNWAYVMFETFRRIPSTFLPYGCFLTKIFENFQVDLPSEKLQITFNEIIDRTILARMKLLNFHISGEQGTSSSAQPQSHSQSQPIHSTPPTSSRYPPSFDDSFFHTLSDQVGNLTTGQERLFTQQETIMKNQQDLNVKVDALSEMLRNHFFPPPPPPSS